MTVTAVNEYPVTNYELGQEVAKGDRITVLESEVTSHPDNTSTLGADRIAMGDPVAVGGIVGVSLVTTTAATDKVVIQTSGVYVFTVNCATTNATPGLPVYIGATNGLLYTKSATGMHLFGAVLGTSTANETTAKVAVRLGATAHAAEA